MHRRDAISALGAAAFGLSAAPAQPPQPPQPPAPAEPPKPETVPSPLESFRTHLCGFDVIKKKPTEFFEAHHFCSPLNDDVHQCVIFNTAGKGAKLIGVEYVISDRLYRLLPESEKMYYHPHTFEVSSGMLAAIGAQPDDDLKLMSQRYTTWGKAWYTWPDPRTDLPMGVPVLMWSATRDGQVPVERLAKRDAIYNASWAGLRNARKGIGPVPQIDPPKTEQEVGRQYTNSGPDVPPKGP